MTDATAVLGENFLEAVDETAGIGVRFGAREDEYCCVSYFASASCVAV